MELRNNFESLKTLLEVSSTTPKQVTPLTKQPTSIPSPLKGDSATLSDAGSEISQGAALPEMRTEKVSAIQAAIASGTYHVPASAVAAKVVDSMLSSGPSTENRTEDR